MISEYCKVCSKIKDCGGKKVSCESFDPIIDIRSKHGRKNNT